ncbi:MAG: phosphatase PAP2 family protein [bacterium]|nr:phosphatase PAP2 family protein [bacterium]
MKNPVRLLIILLTIIVYVENVPAQQNGYTFKRVKEGITDLYTDHNLLYMFLLAGVSANTNIDKEFKNYYQENIRSSGSEDFSGRVKPLGEGLYMFPVYPVVYYLGKLSENSMMEEWSRRIMTAALISAPGILTSQLVLGGARPTNDTGSKWWGREHKFNGASGHTWVAALPFITAAKLTENKILKYLFYISSTATGLSRINDDAHYLSQVILGYSWAYFGVKSTFKNFQGQEKYGLYINGAGFSLYVRF